MPAVHTLRLYLFVESTEIHIFDNWYIIVRHAALILNYHRNLEQVKRITKKKITQVSYPQVFDQLNLCSKRSQTST